MILREKSGITKTMILLELLQGRRKLKEIAKNIDITVQGVSEYMRTLENEGLIKDGEITLKGWEFLENALAEMGEFVHSAQRIISKVSITEAIAGESIKKGDEVGLFMEEGYIHAYHRNSTSMGQAINDADRGDVIWVTNLKGILSINYGRIVVFALPSYEELKHGHVDMTHIRRVIRENNNFKIGVCGVLAYRVIGEIARIDFAFSPVNAAIDAHYRGISTLLFVSHNMVPHVLGTLEERGVPYTLEKIGVQEK